MEGPRGTVYSMGFLLKGTAKGKSATYLTTVGNYVMPTFGTKTWKATSGPRAYDGDGKVIGRFVYAVHTDTPAFSTFGLVMLDPKVKVSPQVCHFGGPTAVNEATSPTPSSIQYYGQGIPADAVSPARTGIVTNTSSPDNAIAEGLVGFGDEGGPVLIDGTALGYLDGGIGFGSSGVGFIVSRLDPWIAKASKALGVKLTLLTAKTL